MNITRVDKYNSRASGDYVAAYIEEKRIKEAAEAKIKADDKRYTVLVIAIKNELLKRNINISDSEFDIKLDEIIEGILEKPATAKRFLGANTKDIRNAVKRSINREKHGEIR